MANGPSLTLSICCLFLTFQVIFGETIENAIHYFSNEDKILEQDLGSKSFVVYPEFYDWEKKKRKAFEENTFVTLILKATNITYYIELQLNEGLGGVPIHVEDEFWESADHDRRCHFHGKIISQPTGFVAISTCSEDGKITGILMMEEKIYFLSPSNKNNRTDKEHYLHEYWQENTEFCGISDKRKIFMRMVGSKFHHTVILYLRVNPSRCLLAEDRAITAELINYIFTRSSNIKRLIVGKKNGHQNGFGYDVDTNRVRRQTTSTTRKVLEVAIFVDNELYKRIETTSAIDPRRATARRVLGIMNQVQLIYNYSSLQTKFKIVVVKLQIVKSNQSAPSPENGDIDKYLDNFCIWQSKLNTREGSQGHWDHAIMLTGRDLYKETRGKRNPKVLGLAWVNGMCRTNYSCTLNEGTSFEAAFVIAHEIAHNLGVMHDGSGNNCDRNKYIMSDKTGPGKVHWSACSNVYMKNFFGSGNGRCLNDDASPPNRSYDLDSRSLPGMRYSLSDQCILALGSGYSPHKSDKEPFNNVCRELWCASGSWAKPAHPALEGSPCAEGKLCIEGLCRRPRNTINIKTTNSSTNDVSTGSARQQVEPENGGILKKIQDTVLKAIKNLG